MVKKKKTSFGIKNYIYKFLQAEAKIKRIIIIFILVLIILITILAFTNRVDKEDKNTTTYNNINTMIKDKDTFLIYYYNSRSKNKYNKEIKEYLDKEKINYLNYNSVLISRNEYTEFLKLLKIDKTIFGEPALIYIKNGKMYANIINIDNIKTVESFIKNYDLYTVK